METLTRHDLDVLSKIADPESSPSPPLLIDVSLPRDPRITNSSTYQALTQRERTIISSMQAIEMQIAGIQKTTDGISPLDQYLACVRSLDTLVEEFPMYASARNNRAQALRRIYGDDLLVRVQTMQKGPELDPEASDAVLLRISSTILSDLDTAISLLSPTTPWASIAPQAAKTLANALTQRGAIYHLTAKRLSSDKEAILSVDEGRKESRWGQLQFEECASRDFMLGGRYGNEIAKNLAVSANPTAKLCGDMVRQAMRREMAGGGE